jgi:hypothetical protein
VDKNNKESVGKGLRDLLYELIAIKDQLYLTLKYQYIRPIYDQQTAIIKRT